MLRLFAVSSFFIRNGISYHNILLVIMTESKSEAIGKFMLSDAVKSTLDKGYVMIGNPPVCVEILIDDYMKKSNWLSENNYIKDADDFDVLSPKGQEEFMNRVEPFSYE